MVIPSPCFSNTRTIALPTLSAFDSSAIASTVGPTPLNATLTIPAFVTRDLFKTKSAVRERVDDPIFLASRRCAVSVCQRRVVNAERWML